MLYVRNNHFEDVRIYLVRGSSAIQLGSVRSLTTRRFVIAPAQLGSSGTLRVVARALASGAVAAPEPLDIDPGAEAFFRVEDNLTYSRLLPGTFRPR